MGVRAGWTAEVEGGGAGRGVSDFQISMLPLRVLITRSDGVLREERSS